MVSPLSQLLSNHMKSLRRPVIWVPLSVSVLLCLAFWQYYRQSDQLATPLDTDASDADASTQLKPDTVRQFLESSRAASPGSRTSPTTVQELDPTLPSDPKLIQPTNQSNAQTLDPDGSSVSTPTTNDPFANYRDEYQFSSGSNAALEAIAASPLPNAQTNTQSVTPSQFNFDTLSRTDSALPNALRRQEEAREQTREQTREESLEQATQSNNSPQLSNPVTGLNQTGALQRTSIVTPYTRTAPETSLQPSPLPNTTRYLAPADTLSPASAPIPNAPSVLYTPPTFSQPDQGRPINPRQ
jgi:hypothetical protein